jgi:hypothetical protein
MRCHLAPRQMVLAAVVRHNQRVVAMPEFRAM